MSWFRVLTTVAGAAAAGAVAARRAAKGAVADRKREILAWAEEEARKRIRAEGEATARRVLRRFALSTTVKLALLGALFAAHWAALLPNGAFPIAAGALLAAFLIRDVVVSWPTLRLMSRQLSKHEWRAQPALGELVAAEALSQALAAAEQVDLGWREKVALVVAGERQDALAQDIAERVSAIADRVAWEEVRPYARSAALQMGGGSALYSLFVAAILAVA
ncbi:MAG: hypothetical protein AAF909_11765 [Pseudomonadota bacterium]